MPRAPLAILTSVMLVSLSCGFGALAPPAESPLPAVSAAPPGFSAVSARHEAEVEGVVGYLARRRTGLAPFELRELAHTIVSEARRRGFDPALVLAVVHVESRANTFAVSPVGALGLMQILPSTGEELALQEGVPWRGPHTLFDPLVNVRLGVAYLEQLSRRYGEVSTALAAYNWGPGHIDRRIARGHALPTEYPSLVLEAHAAELERRS
jgi:soluble lytic murein transglycosylase-like protein